MFINSFPNILIFNNFPFISILKSSSWFWFYLVNFQSTVSYFCCLLKKQNFTTCKKSNCTTISNILYTKVPILKQCFFSEWNSDQLNISLTFFSSKLDSPSPMFWLEENLILSNVLITGESNFNVNFFRRNVQLIRGSFGKEILLIK